MKFVLFTVKEQFIKVMNTIDKIVNFKEFGGEKFVIDVSDSSVEPIYDILFGIEMEQKEQSNKEGFNIVSMPSMGYEKSMMFDSEMTVKHFSYLYKLQYFIGERKQDNINKFFDEIRKKMSQAKIELISDILKLNKQMRAAENSSNIIVNTDSLKIQIVDKFMNKYFDAKKEVGLAIDEFFAENIDQKIKRNFEFIWVTFEVKRDLIEMIYSMIAQPVNLKGLMKRYQEPLGMFYASAHKDQMLKVEEGLEQICHMTANFGIIAKKNDSYKRVISERLKVVNVSGIQGENSLTGGICSEKNERAGVLRVVPYDLNLKRDYVKTSLNDSLSIGWEDVQSSVGANVKCLGIEAKNTSKVNYINSVKEKHDCRTMEKSEDDLKILAKNLLTFKQESLNIKEEYLKINAGIFGAKVVCSEILERIEEPSVGYKFLVSKAQSEVQQKGLEKLLVADGMEECSSHGPLETEQVAVHSNVRNSKPTL